MLAHEWPLRESFIVYIKWGEAGAPSECAHCTSFRLKYALASRELMQASGPPCWAEARGEDMAGILPGERTAASGTGQPPVDGVKRSSAWTKAVMRSVGVDAEDDAGVVSA